MSEYAASKAAVKKTGGLKFKGQKKLKKKKRKREDGEGGAAAAGGAGLDTRHGAFWLVKDLKHLTGTVLIETQSGGYLEAVDDGSLTTGVPRRPDNDPDNMPSPQEIMTVVQAGSDSTVAFKTAYGRYISSTPGSGEVTASTEAFGIRELWKVVMKEDGIMQFRSTDKQYLNGSVP
eukprot:gene23376-19855_t